MHNKLVIQLKINTTKNEFKKYIFLNFSDKTQTMIKYFIPLLIKKATRSSIWQRNLAINIIVGFFLFILILEFLLLGIFLEKILLEANPDGAPEMIIERMLIFYYLAFFLLRFYMQTLPTMDIIHFLHLPISRKKISNFIHLRSLLTFFNFIPFIILLPFSLGYMSSEYGFLTGAVWFLAIVLFELTSNFLLLFVKRKSNNNLWVFAGFLAFFGLVFIVEHYDIISLSGLSLWYFESLQKHFILIWVPFFTMVVAWYFSHRYIIANSYLESIPGKTDKAENLSSRFSSLENYGTVGSLVLNEIRLLLRNKRSKTILLMLPIFLVYGLFFYPNKIYLEDTGWLVFVGIFVTGGFLMAYGQYILSWESRHFDFIQTSNMSRLDFFTAKYYLITLPTILMYIITIPYVFFGREVLLINTMAAIYNIGVNAPLLLFTASFNRKRMELEKSGAMNYQGIGINNFLVIIPLMGIPALGFKIMSHFLETNTAIIIFSVIGILGIIFHKFLIKKATAFFESKRYLISEGFRKK